MGYVTGNHFRLGLAYQREQQKLREQRTVRVPSRLLYAIHEDVSPPVQKKDVWIVEGEFLCEARVGGSQIGEVYCLETGQFNVVAEYSQDECDDMIEEYWEEHGHYPDS